MRIRTAHSPAGPFGVVRHLFNLDHPSDRGTSRQPPRSRAQDDPAYSVSLGRRAVTGQFTRKDDAAVNFYIGVRIGAVFKAVGVLVRWSISRGKS